MNLKKLVLPAATAVAAAFFLLAPEKPTAQKMAPFYGRSFAHRGLHTADGTVPENSLPAFAAAAAKDYGVELDVHLSSDEQVVVFHDDTLLRMCGDKRNIEDVPYSELKEMRLGHTDCTIPLFSEALAVLKGVPIILELKRGRRNDLLCEKTLALIDTYPGPICVESFDPGIVHWFKKNAPDLLRGQLSCEADKMDGISKPAAFLLSHLLTNCVARPNFIAYGIGKKPASVRLCEVMGVMRVAWTAAAPGEEAKNDAVIFQYYLPKVKFK